MDAKLEEIPEDLWKVARLREETLRGLAGIAQAGSKEIEAAAQALGLRRAYVYRLLAASKKRPQTSTLLPKHRGHPKRGRFLDPKLEAIVEAATYWHSCEALLPAVT